MTIPLRFILVGGCSVLRPMLKKRLKKKGGSSLFAETTARTVYFSALLHGSCNKNKKLRKDNCYHIATLYH